VGLRTSPRTRGRNTLSSRASSEGPGWAGMRSVCLRLDLRSSLPLHRRGRGDWRGQRCAPDSDSQSFHVNRENQSFSAAQTTYAVPAVGSQLRSSLPRAIPSVGVLSPLRRGKVPVNLHATKSEALTRKTVPGLGHEVKPRVPLA